MSASDEKISAGQKHVDGDSYNAPPTENPAQEHFNIVVSVPESIKIKMVDASALADYEIWVFIASVCSNGVVGFLVAYLQAVDAKSASAPFAGWICVVLIIIFLLAVGMAIYKRVSISRKGRDIQLKTSSVSAPPQKST
ncbi:MULTISPECIES: hypothetical protein [unclassified Xanthomonas]|uniref:hypothetical protein n=1 Tax=unclassified Xanthomonas TaxID=2643310 RepID=UPI0028832A1B|nr:MULTISPECIES: hypothetical protein [unclassified Xanthomonas]